VSPQYLDWGLTDYENAFERQLKLVEARINNEIGNTLVLTEHHAVYTLGKRKGTEDHLIWDEKTLKVQGIKLAKTNRGGDITYHGPGQIVGYPIICLQKTKDLHTYLRNLEQVLINALGYHGLIAERKEGKTGIWIHNRKIAAIGVAIKRWVTYHGFALNVKNNLDHFAGIIPCGISPSEGTVSSMEKELKEFGSTRPLSNLDVKAIKHTIAVEFWNIFKDT